MLLGCLGCCKSGAGIRRIGQALDSRCCFAAPGWLLVAIRSGHPWPVNSPCCRSATCGSCRFPGRQTGSPVGSRGGPLGPGAGGGCCVPRLGFACVSQIMHLRSTLLCLLCVQISTPFFWAESLVRTVQLLLHRWPVADSWPPSFHLF